jgi:hypothetical protein
MNLPMLVTVRSEAWVCSRLIAGIAGSGPVCLCCIGGGLCEEPIMHECLFSLVLGFFTDGGLDEPKHVGENSVS